MQRPAAHNNAKRKQRKQPLWLCCVRCSVSLKSDITWLKIERSGVKAVASVQSSEILRANAKKEDEGQGKMGICVPLM
jgi:hypothetical protein